MRLQFKGIQCPFWFHRKQARTWYTATPEGKTHMGMKLYVYDPAAEEMVLWVKCLLCRHKDLSSKSQHPHKSWAWPSLDLVDQSSRNGSK